MAEEKEWLRMNKKGERSRSIDIILAVSFVLIAVAIVRGCYQERPGPSGGALPAKFPKTVSEPVGPTAYKLDKFKSADTRPLPGKVGDLREAYDRYPKSNAGGNIIEGWSKVKAEDKVKIREALDKDIETFKEVLTIKPDDKKTKSQLFVSRTLKELISRDFNIKPGEQSAASQAEDPLKIKK